MISDCTLILFLKYKVKQPITGRVLIGIVRTGGMTDGELKIFENVVLKSIIDICDSILELLRKEYKKEYLQYIGDKYGISSKCTKNYFLFLGTKPPKPGPLDFFYCPLDEIEEFWVMTKKIVQEAERYYNRIDIQTSEQLQVVELNKEIIFLVNKYRDTTNVSPIWNEIQKSET